MSKFNKILLSILKKTESKKRDNIKNIFEIKELSQNLIPFDKEQNLLLSKKEDSSKIKLYPSFKTQEAIHRYYYKTQKQKENINLKV